MSNATNNLSLSNINATVEAAEAYLSTCKAALAAAWSAYATTVGGDSEECYADAVEAQSMVERQEAHVAALHAAWNEALVAAA